MRASRAKLAGLQETAAIARHVRGGERRRLRLGAGARRVEDDAVEARSSSAGDEREGEEVAPLRLDPLQPASRDARPRQRIERRLAALHRLHRRVPRQRQRERADAGRRDRRRAARRRDARATSPAMTASASADACRKAPGGGDERHARRLRSTGSASVRTGSPSIESRATPRSCASAASSGDRPGGGGGAPSRSRSSPAARQQHRHPRRLRADDERREQRADAGEALGKRRRQHRAFLDVDEPVRQPLVIAEQRCGSPARSAVSTARRRLAGADADRLGDLRLEALLRQRRDDEVALQPARRRERQHLQRAAAAACRNAGRPARRARGLGSRISTSRPRSPSRSIATRSPGSAKGT